MKYAQRTLTSLAAAALLVAGSASAASWQDQLSSAATQLSQQNNTSNTGNTAAAQNGGLSLSSLSSLLNGGDKTVASNSMTNAAGIMQYCVEHNVVKNNVQSVKDQVLSKLGLSAPAAQEQKTDYQRSAAQPAKPRQYAAR
jgi:hypothetical protein